MLKKLYLFIHKHIGGFCWFWLVLSCFVVAVDNMRVYSMMLAVYIAIWLLFICGQHKKWYLEDDDG